MKTIHVVTALLILTVLVFGNVYAQDVEIGIAWLKSSSMADRVMAGLEKSLKELGPQIKIEYQKEVGDEETYVNVIKRFQSEKDGMVLLRSTGAEYLAKNPPSIPTFIGACNDPKQLGAINDLAAPEGNITGVTYALKIEAQFEVFSAVLPKIKSILLLMEEGHPGTKIDQEQTKSICKKLKIDYSEKICKTKEDIIQAVKNVDPDISAIIIGSEALIMDNTKDIAANAGNIPLLAYSTKPVKDGALCGLAADDNKLGIMLGESIVDVLVNGKQIKDVPVKFDQKPQISINIKAAEKLGLEIPYSILEGAIIIE